MDFAKKQLEKYGWKDGQGLGKSNSGITCAVKPKLKFDKYGLGHNLTEEIINPWWQKVYDAAAGNIKVSKSKTGVLIEAESKTKKKEKVREKLPYGDFIKTSSLTKHGETRLLNNSSESEEEIDYSKPTSGILNMTDEELFKACGMRTAHKGARHGLKMNAKLARVQMHENSFSQGKQIEVISQIVSDNINFSTNILSTQVKEKKRKKKTLSDVEKDCSSEKEAYEETTKEQNKCDDTLKIKRKNKKQKRENSKNICQDVHDTQESFETSTVDCDQPISIEHYSADDLHTDLESVRAKKKKKRKDKEKILIKNETEKKKKKIRV